MGEVFEVIKKNLNITYVAVPSVDGFYGGKVRSTNRYFITWILHQIFMYSDKVMLAAG